MTPYAITITRQFGSEGREIGKQLAERLHCHYYDRSVIEQEAAQKDESLAALVALKQVEGYYKMAYPLGIGSSLKQEKMFQAQSAVLLEHAAKENCVIVGRCADYVLRNQERVLRCYRTLNGAEGSVSVIGAVSPQGNDFSEPVTQNTKRFTRCFWALDKSLAYARHYPAINWNDSYSEYLGDLGGWYYDNVGHDFMSCRERIANLLLQENNLMQIVKLIGSDVLPDDQKLTIEIARVIRVGFLQQNAFHAVDTYVPLEKQLKMMETILYLYDKCAALVAKQVPVSRLLATGLFDELVQMKYTVPNDDLSKLDELQKAIDTKLAAVAQG